MGNPNLSPTAEIHLTAITGLANIVDAFLAVGMYPSSFAYVLSYGLCLSIFVRTLVLPPLCVC